MVIFSNAFESDKDLLTNAINKVVDDFKKKGLIMPQFLKRVQDWRKSELKIRFKDDSNTDVKVNSRTRTESTWNT